MAFLPIAWRTRLQVCSEQAWVVSLSLASDGFGGWSLGLGKVLGQVPAIPQAPEPRLQSFLLAKPAHYLLYREQMWSQKIPSVRSPCTSQRQMPSQGARHFPGLWAKGRPGLGEFPAPPPPLALEKRILSCRGATGHATDETISGRTSPSPA
jgi:hypothetical protein